MTSAIDYDAFRNEVKTFIEAAYSPSLQQRNRRQTGVFAEPDVGMEWHRILHQRGWIAPAWPTEHGGTGWDAVQRAIFESECAIAGTPSLALMGLTLAGPAIIAFGTDEQKAFFLPRILSGEVYFCQGFSEPGSGSDLASIKTAAVRDGDAYVVNGSKIWTTHAHHANWIFMLVRTDPSARPQAGISFLVAPISTPGISIRPIISMSGDHELNQVFFDDARVPVVNCIGDENNGWDVTKYLLQFERGGVSYASIGMGLLAQARAMAMQQPGDARDTLWEEDAFRRRSAELEIDLLAIGAAEHRLVEQVAAGERIGDVAAAVLKIRGSELYQQATELCVATLGDYALADQRNAIGLSDNTPSIGPEYAMKPVGKFLNIRASSIYGGANEVMRGVIAKRALGL